MFVDDDDWRLRALCRDEDPELFFPVGSKGPAARQIEEAKTICSRCPVIRECYDEISNWAGACGVWGGTSEEDRINARRRMRRLARA